MLIDTIYEKLHEQRLCKNAYDFSVRFLGKSKSYYSVLKTRNDIPSIETIATLEIALKNISSAYNNSKVPFFSKTHDTLLELSNDVGNYRIQRSNEILNNSTNSLFSS